MIRRSIVLTAAVLALALVPASASAQVVYEPGSPGLGDPYFPLKGNGGYDVKQYTLELAYDPATDVLTGEATISARATQNLSSFNLDFEDLEIRSIRVNGRPAEWSRDGAELTVTPARGLRRGGNFTAVVVYQGVPATLPDGSGFIHTDDGALAVGQPEVAAFWFPANDHPRDKARFTLRITVPQGLEAIANGLLKSRTADDGLTTWTWIAREPMAPYLATMAIGEFDIDAYRKGGIGYWDAIDPRFFEPVAPRTGERFLMSQAANLGYKRLTRTITVPAEGAQLSFWVTRNTEPTWDFFFVEAHTVGSDDWTTLPDENGHTSRSTGNVCPLWLDFHPFLQRYQTPAADGCAPTGTTGEWHAASGGSDGYEQWTVDLSRYAGRQVEVSLSYASDDIVAFPGVFVDDIEVSTGEGSTSFEDDGDPLDGWTVAGAPEGSPDNENDWTIGTAEDAPPPIGELMQESLAFQPEVIDFLETVFGPYPFTAAGAIVDVADLGFALETQTRPVYSSGFFTSLQSGVDVIVHELAHQWAGDFVALERWSDIWINEGFATYAEWLWNERVFGSFTAQEAFDFYASIPADDPFWSVTIGDPGVEDIFHPAVYNRGAMALHALRLEVGDRRFFRILRTWIRAQAGGNATVQDFIAHAERVTGEDLDELFETWLFTPSKPEGIEPAAGQGLSAAAGLQKGAFAFGHRRR